jgi:hypothetical protein
VVLGGALDLRFVQAEVGRDLLEGRDILFLQVDQVEFFHLDLAVISFRRHG